ncbi:MAG: 4a-hydroxytetrahydrobiopterin dehydratase [Fimbriimonadales bacterium]|nr:4a-hydroxytetrahydrobiopterin dehydratase [Fimbriimonadales bacterium]
MPEALSPEQIHASLRDLPGWTFENGAIRLEREFGSYSEGVLFANGAAALAEAMDHHPDLTIGYRRVVVSLSTHSAGGVTELDLEFARRLTALGR